MNRVSISILATNEREYLPRCLDAVLNQTYGNIELIVIDNEEAIFGFFEQNPVFLLALLQFHGTLVKELFSLLALRDVVGNAQKARNVSCSVAQSGNRQKHRNRSQFRGHKLKCRFIASGDVAATQHSRISEFWRFIRHFCLAAVSLNLCQNGQFKFNTKIS